MARRTTRTLEVRIKAMEARLGAFDKLQKKSKETTKTLGGLAQMGDKIKVAFAGWATQAVTGSFRTAAAAVRKANASFVEFEEGLGRIGTLIPGQVKLQAQLRRSVEGLSRAYGMQATDAANATFQAISAGVKSTDAAKFMEVAAKSATAGFATMEESVSGLTTILNAYGLEAAEATAVSDAMFVSNKRGVTTSRQIGAAIGSVVPLAASLGVSYRELLSGTVALTKQGTSTNEAMTRMRAILAAIIKPTDEAKKVAKDLSVQWDVNVVKAGGFSAVLDTLREVQLKGGAEAMSVLLGRVEATAGGMALASTTGLADFKGALEEMQTISGQTAEALDEVVNTQFFKQKQALQNLEQSWRDFGATVAPIMTSILNFAGSPFEVQVQAGDALDAVTGLTKKIGNLSGAVDDYKARLLAGKVTTTEAVDTFTRFARAGHDVASLLGDEFLNGAKTANQHLALFSEQAGLGADATARLNNQAAPLLDTLAATTDITADLAFETTGLIATYETEVARLGDIETGHRLIARVAKDDTAIRQAAKLADNAKLAKGALNEYLVALRSAAVESGIVTPAAAPAGMPAAAPAPRKKARDGRFKFSAREIAETNARLRAQMEANALALKVEMDAMRGSTIAQEDARLAKVKLAAELPKFVALLTAGESAAEGEAEAILKLAATAGADEAATRRMIASASALGAVRRKAAKDTDAAATKAKKAHAELLATLGQAIDTGGFIGLLSALDGVSNKSDAAKERLAALALQAQGTSFAALGAAQAFETTGQQLGEGMANAIAGSLAAMASGEEGFARSMERMTASVLLNLGKQAAVEAMMQTAKGIAAAATPGVGAGVASGHFAAAAAFAAVAGAGIAAGGAMSKSVSAKDDRDRDLDRRRRQDQADRERLTRKAVGGGAMAPQDRAVINIHVAGAHLTQREAGAAGARAAMAARRARMTPNAEQEAVM